MSTAAAAAADEVQLAGVVLADLLRHSLLQPGDTAGVLFGAVARAATTTVTDQAAARVAARTVYCVGGFVPLGPVARLTPAAVLAAAWPADPAARPLGWFVARRHTALAPSLRERALHAALARACAAAAHPPPVLALVATVAHEHNHVTDYLVLRQLDPDTRCGRAHALLWWFD